MGIRKGNDRILDQALEGAEAQEQAQLQAQYKLNFLCKLSTSNRKKLLYTEFHGVEHRGPLRFYYSLIYSGILELSIGLQLILSLSKVSCLR